MVAAERDLLGNGEVVLLRLLPVNEVDGFGDLARLNPHQHAVAQQVVNGLVVSVETATVVIRLGTQFADGHADLRRGVAASRQPSVEDLFLNVAVALAVGPIAEVPTMQLIAEQGNDTVLRGAFGLANITHLQLTKVNPLFLR